MRKKFLSVLVTAALLLTILLASQPIVATASAARPTAVDGRTLTTDKTGDSSAWIEIAQYGNYSLIIRQTPLTGSLTWYNSALNNSYASSLPRSSINSWYNSSLGSAARLRSFAVTSNAMSQWGSYGMSYVDGISLPLGIAAPRGDDTAFALSFCEAALYCSTQYMYQSGSGTLIASSSAAYSNYMKLLPRYTGANQSPAYWLRTPGTSSLYAGSVGYSGGNDVNPQGRVNMNTTIGYFGHYRPAMWVGSGIFGADKGTVIVTHQDTAGGPPFSQIPYPVDAGPYGPYPSLNIAGYNYVGLAPGSAAISGTIQAGQTLYITHLYTKAPTDYTLIYDPNTGIGFRMTYYGAPGSTIRLVDQGFSKPGYVFDSWNTRADGTGTRYVNGEYIILTSNIVLYAQWVSDNNYQLIIYYPNDNSSMVDFTMTDSRGRADIKSNPFTPRPGYTFVSWNTMPDGSGVTYLPGQPVTLNNYLTLYAQWRAPTTTYTITYNPGSGGYGGSSDTGIIPGSYYTVKNITSAGVYRPSFAFRWWNTKIDNTGIVYFPGQTFAVNDNLTLYAIWDIIY